jgi:hypothetical protein
MVLSEDERPDVPIEYTLVRHRKKLKDLESLGQAVVSTRAAKQAVHTEKLELYRRLEVAMAERRSFVDRAAESEAAHQRQMAALAASFSAPLRAKETNAEPDNQSSDEEEVDDDVSEDDEDDEEEDEN